MSAEENAIQRAILHYLQLKGYFCWRQNNAPVYDPTRKVYRAHNGIKGLALSGSRHLSLGGKMA